MRVDEDRVRERAQGPILAGKKIDQLAGNELGAAAAGDDEDSVGLQEGGVGESGDAGEQIGEIRVRVLRGEEERREGTMRHGRILKKERKRCARCVG